MTTSDILTIEKGVKAFSDPAAPEAVGNFYRLAQGVIIQAVRDAKRGNLAAVAWLTDPETADIWFSLAGLNRRAVLLWVAAGCQRRKRKPAGRSANRAVTDKSR